MDFSIIAGQDKAKEFLRNTLNSGEIHHAYLFHGMMGLQQVALAEKFAQGLLCRTGSLACGECRDCFSMNESNHPALTIVEAEKSSIKIKQIREVIEQSYIGTEYAYRIFLIKDVDLMTAQAANALLKVLEEPSGNVMFLLTTSRMRALLPTLTSRCVKVELTPLSDEDLAFHLTAHCGISKEEAFKIVRSASGSLVEAMRLLKDTEIIAAEDLVCALLDSPATLWDQTKMFVSLGLNFFDEITQVLRHGWLHSLGCSSITTSDSTIKLANRFNPKQLSCLIEETQMARIKFQRNVNKKLLCEWLLCGICGYRKIKED